MPFKLSTGPAFSLTSAQVEKFNLYRLNIPGTWKPLREFLTVWSRMPISSTIAELMLKFGRGKFGPVNINGQRKTNCE